MEDLLGSMDYRMRTREVATTRRQIANSQIIIINNIVYVQINL